MTLQGWIIYNGQLQGDKFRDFAEWIQEAAWRKDSETIILKNNQLHSFLMNNELQILQQDNYAFPDYIVFADKDIYLAKQLELMGIPVFNSSETIATSDDKIATYQALVKNGLPVPSTIIAPKTYYATNRVDPQMIDFAIKTFGFPMIVKEAFGSFGEQVYLIHNKLDLYEKAVALQGKPYMFQEFIDSSYGTDLRLQVVGDEVVAAMKRTSLNDFRANVTTGGTMKAYQPTTAEKQLAVDATKAIDADFAGIDLLIGKDNVPIVCEVNSNAHIRNMYDCTNINVADFIIHHILDLLKEGKKYGL
ncbi:ATP-grasp domain-containing protein [Virgibacillus sp. W0181]|uniref:ATP-grasp domain-containing protein n=1 Tax=Virgibacillus sp. W0181 TaxID=3391581 RepID=UPI003F490183